MVTTAAAIKRVYRDCVFSPRKDGPLKIIADVGNPAYYVQRAREILARVMDSGDLKRAIQLLALAVVELDDGEQP